MLLVVVIVVCDLLLVLLTIVVLIITHTRLYTRLRHKLIIISTVLQGTNIHSVAYKNIFH